MLPANYGILLVDINVNSSRVLPRYPSIITVVFPSNFVISVEGCSTQPPSYESPSPTPLAFPPPYIALDFKLSTPASCLTSPGLAGHPFFMIGTLVLCSPRLLAILVGDGVLIGAPGYLCTSDLASSSFMNRSRAALALLLGISMNNVVVSQCLSEVTLHGVRSATEAKVLQLFQLEDLQWRIALRYVHQEKGKMSTSGGN